MRTSRSPRRRNLLVADLLTEKTLVLCVGCGGVGKTTTAAAFAVAGAQAGRRTAVLTVDPAQRLKTALGLEGLSHEPRRVHIAGAKRSFDALALDTKRMFDALVERFAPDAETAQRIFANRLYQELSNELAGSAEYMAMETLYDLSHRGRYDLLIVDTPPSAHVHDLLAAPNRLLTLLASRAVRFLQSPTSLLQTTTSAPARMALRTLLQALERWSGLPLLRDLSEFVGGFESMLAGFAQRAEHIDKLLHHPTTAFVVVTSGQPRTIALAEAMVNDLREGGYPVAGVVANRVHAFRQMARTSHEPTDPISTKLWANYQDLAARSAHEHTVLTEFVQRIRLPLLATIPVQAVPPTSIAGLENLAAVLLGTHGNE